jgi:hypothetical protein
MTRGDLIRHTALEFGLDKTSGGDEQLLMIDWANEGVRSVLLDTHCRVEVGDQTLAGGSEDFRSDSSILAVLDITISSQTTKPQLITVEEMNDIRRSTSASSPDVTRFAYQGDLLMIWPKPSSNITVRYVYIAKPTEMTSDSHDPSSTTYGSVPIYAHQAILAYMRWRAALLSQVKAPHPPQQYLQFYVDECSRVRKRVRRMGGRRVIGLQAGYPANARISTQNDRYPSN